jgi:hypothetical protein
LLHLLPSRLHVAEDLKVIQAKAQGFKHICFATVTDAQDVKENRETLEPVRL